MSHSHSDSTIDVSKSKWYEDQKQNLSDVLAELMTEDSPLIARNAVRETIDSWMDYHKKEMDKWNALRNLLSL